MSMNNAEELEVSQSDTKEKKKFHINIHIVLITIIVIIFGISVYKLWAWNHGEEIVINPDEDTSEFDVEVLDEILPIANNGADGHVYDDETTILLLGDGDLSFSRDEDNGLASYIAQATGATIYNGSFPYVSLASRNHHMIEQNYPDDIYSLPYLTDAICSGDFSEVDRITNEYHADGNFTQDAVKELKSIDYDNLDVIVIMYDAQDYFQGRAIENPEDDEERCTYVGALKYSIRRLQQTYPYIRIIVSSMFYKDGKNWDGSTFDPDLVDSGNGTISNYVYNQLQTCANLSVSFVDNFYGSINQNNYLDYTEEDPDFDYIKLNDKGRQVLANRIASAVDRFPNDK